MGEAAKVEPAVASWMLVTQNAVLDARILICEDRPGRHAEHGGEVLKWMYARGCGSIEESKISGRAGGQDSAALVRSDLASIASKDP
jgi:hypothetical protein